MARSLGLKIDTNTVTGGTNKDALTGPALTAYNGDPDIWVPATTAQVTPGEQSGDLNNEVRGVRGSVAPVPRRAAPSLTFTSNAYLKVLRALVAAWMSNNPANTGTAPAAITSKLSATAGNVPRAFFATLTREGQTDKLSGLAVNTLALDFGLDQEATVEANLMGLYHESSVTGTPPAADFTGYDSANLLHGLNVKAFEGAVPVQIPCVAGVQLTLDNNVSDDVQARWCSGVNKVSRTDGGIRRDVVYPNQNRMRKTLITGRVDFADVQPTREMQRIFSVPDKLVIEAYGGPLGTTPAADGLMRVTLYNRVWTGGGAEPLNADSDQRAGFEFRAGLDTANKDIEVEFVGATAVTNP